MKLFVNSKSVAALIGFSSVLAFTAPVTAQSFVGVYAAPAAKISTSRFDYRGTDRIGYRSNTKCYKWDRTIKHVANPEADRYKNLYRTVHSTGRLKDRTKSTCYTK